MAAFFKKMSRDATCLRTLWCRHARWLKFKAIGRDWTLTASGGEVIADCIAVYGSIGGSEFTLWLDVHGWHSLAASVLGIPAAAVSGLAETLNRAALECFADEALLGLENAMAMPVSLTRLEPAAPPPSAALPFRLSSGEGPAIRGAWVATERDPAWRPALEKALSALPAPRAALPDNLPIVGLLEMGTARVSVAELAGLEAGDVVLLRDGGKRFLRIGRKLRFAVHVEKGILVADGNTMADTASSPETEEPLTSIDDAEVEVSAQVGRTVVTLAQLRQLGEGQVVEFASPVDSPASLVVGGRVVATGELVDVAGRVGVRITRMAER